MLVRKKIGEILLELGYLTPEQLEHALAEQQHTGGLIGEVLMRLGYIDADQLAQAQAEQYDVVYELITPQSVQEEALNKISMTLAKTLKALPLRIEGNKLVVAMANPLDVDALEILQRHSGMFIKVVYTNPERLLEAIDFHFSVLSTASNDLDSVITADNVSVEETEETADDLRRAVEEAPVVRIVNLLIMEAIQQGASDIHLEPRRTHMEVRYRIDGELHHARNIPRPLMAACVSRIKVMADMDIAERRIPQDGRITLRIEGRQYDLRVSTLPIQHGERVALRILDRERGLLALEELGFSPRHLHIVRWLLQLPNGLILVTGPTGSGKTTTLYAALSEMRSVHRNIVTCEDPIEYELEGVNQSNVNERGGLTFAVQLRAILRQDPDVVLVGEIRDQETAEIACRAAMTGHIVLSTLHTNDSAGAIPRLIDMGVEPFLIASSLRAVIAQRLLRRICPHCRSEYVPTPAERRTFGLSVPHLYRGEGCPQCSGRGYLGRIGVHEILVVDEEIRTLTLERASSDQLREAALRKGMVSMTMDGVEKAVQGLTTLEEVIAKTLVSHHAIPEELLKAA